MAGLFASGRSGDAVPPRTIADLASDALFLLLILFNIARTLRHAM